MGFSAFNFTASLQEGLEAMGFDTPTPVQEQAIPEILAGHDLIACAQTGTGKTAAFVLPILHRIAEESTSGINTLILAPTRELAIQIEQQIQGFGYFTGVSSIPVYGGGDGATWEVQKRALTEGADIVVATPGRLIALLAGGKVDLSSLQHLILDEADRMLDMGFSDDLFRIVKALPTKRQTILFSATMPPRIRQFAKKILSYPFKEVTLSVGKTAEGVTQQAFMVHDPDKEALLVHLLAQKPYEAVIIFASTKDKVKSLFQRLRKTHEVEAFHSDLDQMEREEIMSRFKNRKLKVLIGTDIISRGIDVVGIELVVNYDVPGDPEDYVHRVGRTARADSKGEAITFINEKDIRKFNAIEDLIGMEIEKPALPEGMQEGPSYGRKGKGGGGGGGRHKRPSGGAPHTASASSGEGAKRKGGWKKKRSGAKKPGAPRNEQPNSGA
ncbi:MAG: DEAD/DEAH box helicase [Nitritalea sp.]